MKKRDILYLLVIMLLIYAFSNMVFNSGHVSYKDLDESMAEFVNESTDDSSPYAFDEYYSEEIGEGWVYTDEEVIQTGGEPVINARSAIVMDFETGMILYEKNAYRKRPMASTTKIMTAIIAIENSSLDEDVLISPKAAGMGGSVMGIKANTVVKMRDLLHGLLICSGNDAAVAIAEHIGGTIEDFCELMNRKALEIGAFSTSFSNPHGLDAENHYTTAYDLAKITRYALRIPEINEIIRKTEFYFNGRTLKNTNEMLTHYEGADGVKTGYTGLAGRCLVTSATRNNMRLISVVLFCDTKDLRTSSSRKILDYSFSEYSPVELLHKGGVLGKINVDRSRTAQEIMVGAAENLKAVLKHNEKDTLYTKISIPKKVTAPVKKGTIMGTISIYKNDSILAETSLIALNSAERKVLSDYINQVVNEWVHTIR